MTEVNGYRLFSNSEIQTFKSCRRRWWLSWYRGLTPRKDEYTGVKHIGSRIHLALEHFYVPAGQTPVDPIATHEIIVAAELDKFYSHYDNSPFGFPAEELKALEANFALERVMLEGYIGWLQETGEDSTLEVIESETYVESVIPATFTGTKFLPVKIIGKIDTRVKDLRTGRRKFIDHKTVQSLDTRMLRQSEQMLHYHLLEWLNTEEGEARCDGALYNMMKRSKRTARATPPFYHREPVDHNRFELESYRDRLVGVITDIQRAEQQIKEQPSLIPTVMYPTPSRDCTWKCPFQKVCTMFDDGSRVEDALENLYQVRDPMSYYGGQEQREDDE